MELNKIDELIKTLPEEQRSGILKLIDLKTEQDMKEVMRSNELLRASIEGLKDSLNGLKESLNEKVNHLESKNDAKFEAQNSKFNMIFWALGAMITIIVALKIFG